MKVLQILFLDKDDAHIIRNIKNYHNDNYIVDDDIKEVDADIT